MRHPPPLQLLAPFEAAARLGSFKLAAAELHVTPSAISQQIRTLEDWLEVSLFDRLTRQVVLTAAGQQFHALATRVLQEYRQSYTGFRERFERPVIRVSMIPFIAHEMVLPRLHEFQRLHPDIDLRIETSMELVDFASEPVDAAVRFGTGGWPGLVTWPLSDAFAVLVAAPGLLATNPLRNLDDLRRHTLIHTRRTPDDWQLAAHKLGLENIAGKDALILDDYFSGMHAAAQGLGIAIALLPITRNWIRDGRLATPFPLPLKTEQNHQFVCRREKASHPAILALYEWLKSLFDELQNPAAG